VSVVSPLLNIFHWSIMPRVAAYIPWLPASISGLGNPSNCGKSFTSILHTGRATESGVMFTSTAQS